MNKFGQLHHTIYEKQLGLTVEILNECDTLTSLTVFCDATDADGNTTIKVQHGEDENMLLNTSVEPSSFKIPTLQLSANKNARIIRFDDVDVFVTLTDEGVVVDVYDATLCEEGCIDSAYLFDDELFPSEETDAG